MADFLFGSPGASQKPIVYSGVQIPTSAYDLPVQWLRGQRRVVTNCMWTGDFQKHKQSAKGKGGGKGAGQYTYTAAVQLGLGFGVIDDILNVWTQGSATSTTTLAALGLTLNSGTALQSPWSFLVTNFPSQALAYANIANLVSPKLDLGSSASIPDMAFEARQVPYADYLETAGWTNPTTSANTPGRDVNMADFLPDFLMEPLVGGGFAGDDIPDLTQFRAYQAAQGLFFSPYLNKQEKATDTINRWAQLSNSWIYWSGTSFVVVPLGDTELTANGYTYTPELTVDYALGPKDFISNPPVKVMVKDPADCCNRTTVTITDRTMGYVTNPIEYKAPSLIKKYGLSPASNVQADDIACPAVGNVVAQLIGRRAAHLTKTYSFKTSWRFVRALPGCIFSLTDPTQGLDAELVRITEVEEDEAGDLTWSAEELPANIGTYHTRNVQPGPAPTTPDQQSDPGAVNTPAVVEPAQAGVVDTTTVLIAASGGANWGGANVWVSFDDWSSQSLIGKIQSPAIQGVLTADLASYGGTNPDTGHTLSVDATISRGEPEPVSNADADGLRTLSLVCAPPSTSGSDQILDNGGELLAFGDTATTGTYEADLTYLQRGQLGTAAGAHATDDLFTLFDLTGVGGSTLQYRLPAQYVGQPIWLKFASFNIFGRSTQDLSVCQSYKYTPTGSGFGGGSGGVPSAPVIAAVTASGPQQNKVTVTPNPPTDNVTEYEIYRVAGPGGASGSATLVGLGQIFYDTIGPTPSAVYTYFAKAENGIGLSAFSAGVDVTTSSSALGGASGADPTATASDVAVDGTADTFMRSDAAPAVQIASDTQFGLVKVDGTTITETGGVISAAGGGSSDAAQDLLWFGDGSDGNVTISAGTTTLARDMYYHDLTITGGAIAVNGFKVFVSGTLDISAAPAGAIIAVASNGGNASTISGGSGGNISTPTAATLGSFYNGGSGANGGTGAGGQGNADSTTTANAHGGKAGEGGAGGSAGSGGGTSRAANTPSSPQPVDLRRLSQELAGFVNGNWSRLGAGGGGPGGSSGSGDGGGSTGGSGGGGGSSGNCLYLAARTIARGSSVIAGIFQAKGGNGGTASVGQNGTNRGGGGGGGGAGGGWIYLIYRIQTGSTITNALDATGGDGGAGANGTGTGNGGDGGGAGGGGRIDKYDLGNGTKAIVEITAPTAGNAHSTGTGGAAKTATAQKANL